MGDGQPNPERKNASSVTTHLRESSTNHLPQTPVQSPLAGSVARLWHDEENPPDIIRFLLSQDPSLPAEELLGACLVDQRESWSRGVGRLAELYWNFLKVRCRDLKSTVLWDLVESEWSLRTEFPESGRLPLVSEFQSRFPALENRLVQEFSSPKGDLDATRDLNDMHESTASVGHVPALDPTVPVTRKQKSEKLRRGVPGDYEVTTIELDDEDSALTVGEDEYDHDPESVLGRCRPFSQLPPALLQRIEGRMETAEFQPGEFLIRQGDEGDGLFVINNGHVEVRSTDADGVARVLAQSGSGEIMGEMALITDEQRMADVVATSEVDAQFLPQKVFDDLASSYPVISQVLTQLLAERLGKTGHDALAGKTLDDYSIQSRLGRGGMAIVYKAEHVDSSEVVALKMMSHRLVYDAKALELFQREARIIESFDHPNIVRMKGRFKAFRSYFIVMEFCPGVALDEFVRDQGYIEPDQFRSIFGQIIAGLNYAHQQGVIHRDIKPSNVMLTPDGHVKLMDFGLAKPVAGESSRSRKLIAGTPRYMAPEQFMGRPVDTRADLFAVGVTAYKLLTGKNLISSRSLSGIERQHASWQVPDLSEHPQDIAEFVSACLQKKPDDRNVDLDAVSAWVK